MGIVKQFKTAEGATLDLAGDEALAALLADYDKAVEDRKRASRRQRMPDDHMAN